MAKDSKQEKHKKQGLLKIGGAILTGAVVLGKILGGNKEESNS